MFTGLVRIAAYDFTVEAWDNREATATKRYGECSCHELKIRIDSDLLPTKERDTMWHELLHAIYWAYGVYDEDKEERTVGALATGIAQVMRDNPELRKYLAKQW